MSTSPPGGNPQASTASAAQRSEAPRPPPTLRRATRHQRAAGLYVLACGTAWLGFVGLTLVLTHDTATQQGLCLAALAVLGGALALGLRRQDRAFRCPDCGGPVEPPLDTGGQDDAPLLRQCRACNVLWHVGKTPTSG